MPPKGKAAPPAKPKRGASGWQVQHGATQQPGAKKAAGKPPSARPLASPSSASTKPGGRSSPAPPSSSRGAAPSSAGGGGAPSKPATTRPSTVKSTRFDAAAPSKPQQQQPAKLKRAPTQELSSEAKAALSKSTQNLDLATLKATEPPQGVLVAVRVRPMGTVKREEGQERVVEMDGNTTRVRDPHHADAEVRDYAYDHSYWSFDGFKTLEDGTKAPDGPSYAARHATPRQRRRLEPSPYLADWVFVTSLLLTCLAPSMMSQVDLRLSGEGVGRHRHGGARQLSQRLRRDRDGLRADGRRQDLLGAGPPARAGRGAARGACTLRHRNAKLGARTHAQIRQRLRLGEARPLRLLGRLSRGLRPPLFRPSAFIVHHRRRSTVTATPTHRWQGRRRRPSSTRLRLRCSRSTWRRSTTFSCRGQRGRPSRYQVPPYAACPCMAPHTHALAYAGLRIACLRIPLHPPSSCLHHLVISAGCDHQGT